MAGGGDQEDNQDREATLTRKVQYPLDSSSYQIVGEIGVGASAVVYKALCLPMNSSVVAIKSIDLDRSRSSFDTVRLEAKTMSLLSHPNILNAHCSFAAGRRLWVVMPFMSGGSLQSIIASSFPCGLTEPCIAAVLRDVLAALSYLHDQGHLHRDIKAGNILLDSNGAVKLADFGVSASIYEQQPTSSASASPALTEFAGTPYWMAPEVIHSQGGGGCYGFKADIWSFGITALELAHGRPPLSHLPLSKSLLLKITGRFRFSDYSDKNSASENDKQTKKKKKKKKKKFSKAFKDMVGLCLHQDPAKRPTAGKLLKHSFFKNCKGPDFLVKNLLQGLPSVEERFALLSVISKNGHGGVGGDDDDDDDEENGQRVKQRRISGWNFNEDGFELDPVFPSDSNEYRQVRFGGETFIQNRGIGSGESSSSSTGQAGDDSRGDGSGESEHSGSDQKLSDQTEGDADTRIQMGTEPGGSSSSSSGPVGEVGVDRESMLRNLLVLTRSLDEQRRKVNDLIVLMGGDREVGETNRDDQMVQLIERLKMELEMEKQKNFELQMELEFLKLQLHGPPSFEASLNG